MDTPSTASKWLRRSIPLLILAAGILGTVMLLKSRKAPKRSPTLKKGVLVDVLTVRYEDQTFRVTGNGVVQAQRQVNLSPEVSGKVQWVNSAFVVGGFIKAGGKLFTIEAADYRLRVDRAKSAIAQAEQQLAQAESNARVARQEWGRLGQKTVRGKPTDLMLHLPQLKAARANLEGARTDLQQARLNLARTVYRAPFNCRVRSKSVDRGQYVVLGQALGSVYDTDLAEVEVSLPVAELKWLRVPKVRAGAASSSIETGSRAIVRLGTGIRVYRREGHLSRAVGEIDPTGRMSKVIVSLVDPFRLKPGNDDGRKHEPDFELGAFVEVEILGSEVQRVVALPPNALRVGSVVWLVKADETLEIRSVQVARRTKDAVLLKSGLVDGDRVILTNLTGVLPGMKLRTAKKQRPRRGPDGARRDKGGEVHEQRGPRGTTGGATGPQPASRSSAVAQSGAVP
jgi:RND family efflux transporter MFP subunit